MSGEDSNIYTSPPGEHTVRGQRKREWRRRGGRLNQSRRRSPAVVSMTVARRGVATDDNHTTGKESRVKSQIESEERNQRVRRGGGCDLFRMRVNSLCMRKTLKE